MKCQVPNWLTNDFPPAVKAKVNRLWGGEWHGQAQKWYVSLSILVSFFMSTCACVCTFPRSQGEPGWLSQITQQIMWQC